MDEVNVMHHWVQGCLGGDGKVNLEVCDGVPGNWTLYYLGTKPIKCSRDVQGASLVRYRSHYRLHYLCTAYGAVTTSIMQMRMEERYRRGEGPGLSILPGEEITVEEGRRLQVNQDGTSEYAVDIYVAYDRYYPAEVIYDVLNFTLDGEEFQVDLVSLRREFQQAEGQSSCITLDGQHHRQVKGTYYNYTMTVRGRPGQQQELERFWQKISAPTERIQCCFPYGQQLLTQQMYVQEGSQELLPGQQWDQVTVRFLAAQPQEAL